MYSLNPTIQSQIRVALMLRSIVATKNSANTQFRLKKNSLTSDLCLISACSRSNWIYCYFIYLFFKTFKICIFKAKIVFPYFEGIFVQNTGNSYYLAGLRVRMLHYLRVGLRITITQSHVHTMQQTHTHKAVTGRVEAKMLLSRRRQSEHRWR